jgi:hypothetical protein
VTVRTLGEHRIKAVQLEWNETNEQNFGESQSLVRGLLPSLGTSFIVSTTVN